MRGPLRTTGVALALATVALLVLPACSDDDDGTSTSSTRATTTVVTQDPELEPLLVQASDLPPGFAPSEGIDDTITAFCAGEDAAAGLQATGRALAGYTREPAGASVIHLVFRFRTGDAARFVDQATQILDRCSNVPDATGLAFAYEPAAPELEAALAGATDGHVVRYGTSAGSASLGIDVAVFRHGEVGHLVAVLAVDTPRAELDALALAAVTAAATLPPGGP